MKKFIFMLALIFGAVIYSEAEAGRCKDTCTPTGTPGEYVCTDCETGDEYYIQGRR